MRKIFCLFLIDLRAVFGKKSINGENYVTDKNGRKIAVQNPIKLYEKLVADSEELDEIKEYRVAKLHNGNAIQFEQAFKEIEDAVK